MLQIGGNKYLLSIVYIGSVWLAGKSLSELNKTVSNEKVGFVHISLNTFITYLCFENLHGLTLTVLTNVINN